MLWAIHYDTRESVTTKEQVGALMTEFGKRGEMAGTVGHWTYPGGGGVIIVEEADAATVYDTALAYSTWLDFDIKPVIAIDEAVGKLSAWLSD